MWHPRRWGLVRPVPECLSATPGDAERRPATAHLFISNPFKGGGGVTTLFSTHPSTAERVQRLERTASSAPHALSRGFSPAWLAGSGLDTRMRSSHEQAAHGSGLNPRLFAGPGDRLAWQSSRFGWRARARGLACCDYGRCS
jgi:hypothetical protein